MKNLNFTKRVDAAIRIVKKTFPKAKLYEVDGVSSSGLTNKPTKIDKLRVVFRNSDNKSIIISSKNAKEFHEPKLTPKVLQGDRVIQWPIPIGLKEINKLKEAAGFNTSYNSVSLCTPFGSAEENPYYIFSGNPKEPCIFIDINTKKVQLI